MSKITKYALSDLYDMSSGLSSKKEQAGHGAPFVSFGTVLIIIFTGRITGFDGYK